MVSQTRCRHSPEDQRHVRRRKHECESIRQTICYTAWGQVHPDGQPCPVGITKTIEIPGGDMSTKINPEKKVDLPPTGRRNADPLTNAPGAHPVETGVGAAAIGAVSGMAAGAVAGPVGAAIGAAVGAVAGGYAGKGVGEMIDPT